MGPFTSVTMDFITDLPNLEGFDYIWVVVDCFTKTAVFTPCNKTIDAEKLERLYLAQIYCVYRLPREIILDQGALFVSKFWKRINEYWVLR